MKYFQFLFLFLLSLQWSCAQKPAVRPAVESVDFDQRLTQLLSFSVPVMGVEELTKKKGEVLILDAREEEEYQVSHIPGSRFLGYKNFSEELLADVPKDTAIVLYCSVGYRSEKIGEQLQKLGFTNVHNLYGSIFEWANQGHPLENKNGEPTKEVHTYNRNWSKWVEEGDLIKVW